MRACSKLLLLLGIFVVFFSYSFAEETEMDGEERETETDAIKLGEQEDEIVQKPEIKLLCELKPGFEDKINKIKDMCTKKIIMLKKIDASLKEMLPLVKNPAIRNKLMQRQKDVQTMKKNYTDLKLRLEKNPKSVCGQTPVWKIYNEEIKAMVDGIRTQFRLLKK